MADFDPTDYGGDGIGDDLGLLGLDAEEDDPNEVTLKDALLFVIDCSFKGVLEPLKPGGKPAVAEVLASAMSVFKTKVITSPDDRVGVLLYGVREKNNPNSFEGIRVIQELDKPNAQRIKQLRQEVERTAEQFEERYGMSRPVPLSDVFWTCTTIFNLNANPKRYQPRVFLFTGNEMPCSTLAEQDAAETRARDLLDLGVDVEFFPMTPSGSTFSVERFWGRVLPVEGDDYVSQAAVRVEELERRVRRRVHRKRVLNRLPLELCPGVEVSVGIYVNTIPAKIPQSVYLLNENNKLLKSDGKFLCEQTGSILHPVEDVQTYVEVAGQRVYVTRAEVNEARYFGEPSVKVLGFKSANTLQSHHRIFHSYFVYPNEKDIKGSGALCATLLESMLERKVMAVVRYIPRKSSIPFLAALLPQAESDDPAGVDQVRPPGFQMVLLPFADEIRRLVFPAPEGIAITEDMVKHAKDLVDALRIDGFTPGCVENPVLQRHYASVQALALGEEQPEETVDVLQPDAAALTEKAPIIGQWQKTVEATLVGEKRPRLAAPRDSFPSHAVEQAPPAIPRGMSASHRLGQEMPGASFGLTPDSAYPSLGFTPAMHSMSAMGDFDHASKRPRIEAPEVTPEMMHTMVATGEVERLTVSQLREYLRTQGVGNTGKKSDLVHRVRSLM